jgi:hypothetical protein
MTPAAQQALAEAGRLGVTVRVADDEIMVSPAGLLTPDVRARLLAERFEIVRFLRREQLENDGPARAEIMAAAAARGLDGR